MEGPGAAHTDRLLPYFIRIQRLVEEVNAHFDYDGYQKLPQLDATRTDMLLKNFNRQIKQIEESLLTHGSNNGKSSNTQ